MGKKLRITVDHDVCVGNDMCTNIAMHVFGLNENMQAEVVNQEGDTYETVLEAAENCPVGAIKVAGLETGDILFP